TLGVDDLGYPFQRMRAAICQNPALGCLNNGYFDGTKCQCPKYWTGALCQTAVCVNGGSNDGNSGGDGTACNCPSSYSGQFCEQIVCSQQSPPNFGYGSRSLVLIVDASINFIPVFNTFKAGLSEFLNAVGSGTRDGFFRNYIFIPMHGAPAGQPTGSLGDIFISTSIPDFVAAVNNTLPLIGGCPLPIYSAISTALLLPDLAENSIIYVISNSLAQDVTTEAAILVAVQQTRAQISFVLPGDGINYGCGSLSNSNPNVLSYQNLTLFSGGALFFPVAQNLMALLNTYTSTLYGGAIITEGYQASCGQMQLIVPVEYGLSNIDILVRASTATLSIASPNGTLVTPLSYLPQSTGTYFGHIMLSIADVTARGYWIMNITTGQSPIPCVVQVKGSSNVQLYYQFVQGVGALNMDGGSTAPSPLTNENYIIVHAAGVHPSMAGRLTFVEFFDLQLRQTVFVLPLVKRKSCSYEYISATSFTCPGKSFGMSVNGLDDSLLPFKRLYFVQCSDTSIQSTVTTQTPLTALNMINADFIFAIDVAEIADTGDFQVTKVFIEKFVENCTVGPQNSQFAVITYNSGGVTNDGFNLNSYSSSLPLLNAISNVRLSITQDPMTDLMGTINYILNTALQPSAGYRNGQAFVIFMATSTASISDTNQTLVLSLNQATTPYAFNMYGSDLTKQYIQPILNDYPNSYSSLSKPSDFLTNPAIAQQFTQYIQTRYQGSLTTPSGPLCRQPYVQQETCGMIDIVLVLDASTSMPSQSFTDLQCFFSRYFASKVIGTTGVQVAAIVYAGSAFVRWDITQSSDLSSLQTAIEGLAQLQTSEDPANSGQNIFGALTIVQSSVTTRPAASKFIVLVSSKPYSGADPRKIADELRTSFTILGVSFDPNGNNIGLLQLLSGDAKQVLQIPNSDQFGQFLKQFVCS
uniref:Uncharacterized protein n=1 Tax=Plectus sambesii TaxID=2011161 RepID=A0A914WX65_9BILA